MYKNLSFRKKLIVLIFPLLAGLLFFSGQRVYENIQERSSISQVAELLNYSVVSSRLVHELQKERGLTAGFLSSDKSDDKFKTRLNDQRKLTDQALLNQQAAITTLSSSALIPSIISVNNEINNDLKKLPDIRKKVDQRSIQTDQAIPYYTGFNAHLLSVSAKSALLSGNGILVVQLRTYFNFLQAKERAGIERAVMSSVFNLQSFQGSSFQKVNQLIAEQNAYIDNFKTLASADQLSFFSSLIKKESFAIVESMRSTAASKYIEGGFGVDAQEWFTVATNRINALKEMEDKLAEDILIEATVEINRATVSIWVSSIVSLVLILLVGIIVTMFTRQLGRQIKTLSESIAQASASRDVSVRCQVLSTDELGLCGTHFNNMMVTFEKVLSQIDLNSVQLATASEETSSVTSSTSHNLEQQKNETAQVAAATEEMSSSIREVSASVLTISDSADLVGTNTKNGVEGVARTLSSMKQLKSEMSNANERVTELRTSSSEIHSIVDVIKAVAEQTNLLALNAAIEAARAGEQGRGFAVVADEVRTLAQRTQESTNQIESMVARFQTDSDNVASTIEKSVAEVDDSVQQTELLSRQLNDIQHSVIQINDLCSQVTSITQDQVTATSEIAEKVGSIESLSMVNSEAGSQILDAAEQQALLAASLRSLASSFNFSRS